MRRARVGHRVGVVVLASVCVMSACATLGDGTIEIIEDAKAPAIEVTASHEGAPGTMCGAQAELVRGSVPADARRVVELEMTSAVPEGMRAFEETARLHAQQRCANGVSLLRAVDAGGEGYLSVRVALWERVPTPP